MRFKTIYGRTDRYFIDDTEVTKEEYDAALPNRGVDMIDAQTPPMTNSLTGWPLISFGAAVDPSQIDAAEAHNRRVGDNVRYVRPGEEKLYSSKEGDIGPGDAIFTSRHQRKLHLKNKGFHDRIGGYGD